MIPIDLTGKKFGRLTIIKYIVESKNTGHAQWFCECTCGNYMHGRGSHLTSGNIKSCGCLSKEKASKRLKKYASSKQHHGNGNPAWKGDDAKVAAIHNWLSRHFEKKKCEHCSNKKILDWALKTGYIYAHIRKSFLVLCRSCHLKYDYASGIR